ncbi:flavin reductase family protein [Nocardia sp. NPDC057353]|uniref:flavin reductase family protein n=1 Tax=Nocardia sp. NPDC057353 TaxID=3346104 RepID=UPI0036283328
MQQQFRAPADADGLRRAFGAFPSGVVAVCAEIDGVPVGLAVSSFVPVSLDPPLVSFCVQLGSATWPVLRRSGKLGLSLLGTGQREAARTLGTRAGDRFAGVGVRRGEAGAVFVEGSAAWIEGVLETVVPAGDHEVALVRIERIATEDGAEPLIFHGSRFRQLLTEQL